MTAQTLQPISEDLHRRVKAMASSLGLDLKEAVDQALEMWLEAQKENGDQEKNRRWRDSDNLE